MIFFFSFFLFSFTNRLGYLVCLSRQVCVCVCVCLCVCLCVCVCVSRTVKRMDIPQFKEVPGQCEFLIIVDSHPQPDPPTL